MKTDLAVAQRDAFKAVLESAPHEVALKILLDAASSGVADAKASLYLVDADGQSLRAFPGLNGLPEAYCRIVDRWPIGAASVACGLCAHFGIPVITPDVEKDSSWAAFVAAAREFGFRGCWSFPVVTAHGEIVATLALYHAEPREPTCEELECISEIAASTALVLQHAPTMDDPVVAVSSRAAAQRDARSLLAHELRTPLSAIQNAAARVALRPDDAAGVLDAARLIDRQSNLLDRLLTDMLNTSNPRQAQPAVKRRPTELLSLVQAAIETTRHLFDEKNHELAIERSARSLVVELDPAHGRQIVTNLLTNACKFTERGGRVVVSLHQEERNALLCVQDSGIGMTPGVVPQVFDLYERAHALADRVNTGWGIGLAVVKALTDLHGGTVEARSDGVGRGSEFRVRFPLCGLPEPVSVHHAAQGPAR